jgi:hypothetical protein
LKTIRHFSRWASSKNYKRRAYTEKGTTLKFIRSNSFLCIAWKYTDTLYRFDFSALHWFPVGLRDFCRWCALKYHK